MAELLKKGTVSVKKAASVLGVDAQTLRLMLQNRLVDFGMAFKRPGSRHFSYLIFAEPFYRLTGYRAESNCNNLRECEITDKLALEIIDKGIERCESILLTLKEGTEDFDSIYMELRSYQMHRDFLLRGGEPDE